MSEDPAARLAALEQLDEDLFDFPDVEGMQDLLAASRAAASGAPAKPSSATVASNARAAQPAEARGSAAGEPKAPLPAPKASAPATAERPHSPPRNAGDLDEDLFGFGELLELGAAPDVEAKAPAAAPQARAAPAPENARP